MKGFLLVLLGSGIGGGLRFLVSKGMTALMAMAFPLGTFTVNIVGSLIIGLFAGIPATQS